MHISKYLPILFREVFSYKANKHLYVKCLGCRQKFRVSFLISFIRIFFVIWAHSLFFLLYQGSLTKLPIKKSPNYYFTVFRKKNVLSVSLVWKHLFSKNELHSLKETFIHSFILCSSNLFRSHRETSLDKLEKNLSGTNHNIYCKIELNSIKTSTLGRQVEVMRRSISPILFSGISWTCKKKVSSWQQSNCLTWACSAKFGLTLSDPFDVSRLRILHPRLILHNTYLITITISQI